MTGLPTTGDYITQMYLYGKVYTPESLTDRLRDLPPGEVVGSQIAIDANDYMSTYGVYAVPARAQFVQSFFNGSIVLPEGIHSVSELTPFFSASQFRFTFQHAQVDVGNNNYMDRAYIFGHSSFHLSDDTKFKVESDGTLSIIDLKVIPENDNFDFVSTGIAQYLNVLYLQPTMDPSEIGRKVEINYTGSILPSSYSSQDFVRDIGRVSSWGVSAGIAAPAIANNIVSYVEEMRSRGVFETERDGREIRYDGQRENFVGAIGVDDGAILIGGSQDDVMRGYIGNDILYGGEGNDLFRSSAGNDEYWGGNEAEKPEISDNDKISYSQISSPITVAVSDGIDIKITKTDGVDVLHSIEEIEGTTGRDYFKFSGNLPQDYYLKIDAGDGQEGRDIIKSGSKLLLDIDNSGHGYLISSISNGLVELFNFHTKVIGSSDNDIISDASDGDKHIDGGAGDDHISVSAGNASLLGGGGDDLLTGGLGNDVLNGGSGRDELYGGAGSDILIGGDQYGSILPEILEGGDGSDKLIVSANGYSSAILRGGAGNDIYESHTTWDANSKIEFRNGDGHDEFVADPYVESLSTLGGVSVSTFNYQFWQKIEFPDWSIDDVKLVWDSHVIYGNGQEYQLRGDMAVVNKITGESMLFRDVIGVRGIYGGATLSGPIRLGDNVTYGSINGVNLPSMSFSDGDVILEDGISHVDFVMGSIEAYDLAQTDFAAGMALNPPTAGTSDDDFISGTGGSDNLSGGAGDDEFEASEGSDTVDGGDGQDTYSVFGYETDFSFSAGAAGEVVVTDMRSNAKTTLKNVEKLYFSHSDVTKNVPIFGTTGADTLISGTPGDDVIRGLDGDDLIEGLGGNDIIDGGDGYDTARYSGARNDYRIGWQGNQLQVQDLRLGSPDASDLLSNIESLSFLGDTSSLVVSSILPPGGAGNDIISGTPLADRIEGNAGNDTINPDAGDDIVVGGTGNDTIYESVGNDTYVWSPGEGDDFVTGGGSWDGVNTVEFGPGVTAQDLRYAYADGQGYGLKISVAGQTGSITIDYQFLGGAEERIDQFRFGDGSTLSRQQFQNAALAQLATAGNDTLWGSQAGDVILGSGGNDTLDARGGNDTIIGGTGNDLLLETDGDDTYVWNLGDGDDYISGGSGSDGYNTIQFGQGITAADLRYSYASSVGAGYGLKIAVAGQPGSVTIDYQMISPLNERIDRIRFADGSVLTREQFVNAAIAQASTSGNDIIWGSLANETISSGNGDDRIDPRGGSDIVVGGSGDDTLIESEGDDIYVWNFGDDDDYISGGFSSDGYNVIKFGPGIAAEDLRYDYDSTTGAGYGLKIRVAGHSGSVTIDYEMVSPLNERIDELRFDDGTSLTREQFIAAAIDQATTTDADTVWGSLLDDTIHASLGADHIDARQGNDYIAAQGGDDTIVEGEGNDTYVWHLGDDSDYIIGGSAFDGFNTIQFGPGIAAADLRYGYDNRISDGFGLKIWVAGHSGSVTIDQQMNGPLNERIDQIRFDDGSILTREQFMNAAVEQAASNGSDEIWGSQLNETIYGLDDVDYIDPRGGNDRVIGGSGDDTIKESEGDDTYVWNLEDDDDVITGGGSTDGFNTIEFGPGITAADLRYAYTGGTGYGLKITIPGDDGSIVLESQLVGGASEHIDQLKFADGSILSREEFQNAAYAQLGTGSGNDLWGSTAGDVINGGGGNDTIDARSGDDIVTGGAGNDTLIDGLGADTYVWNLGDGNDTITQGLLSGDTDVIQFGTGISTADIACTWVNDGDALRISVNGQPGSITLKTQVEELHFADSSTMSYADLLTLAGPNPSSLTQVNGTNASETLVGTVASERFNGKLGDDTLIGGSGSDVYIYASGDGNDSIFDENTTIGVDKLRLVDLNADDVTLRRDTYHLYVKDNATGHEIQVQYQYHAPYDQGIEQIEFADGTLWDKGRIEQEAWLRGTSAGETILGTAGNDVIYGAGGNDYIEGRAGSDTYIYASGDGADDIFDEVAAGTTDTLKLLDLDAANVTLRRDNYHLFVKDNATGQETRVQYQFIGHGIEQLQFANGTVWDRSRIELEAWYRGGTGSDSIIGTSGNETFRGGAGNDYMEGGTGSDTYVYGSGDGADDIWDIVSEGSVDIFKLTDLNAADVTFRRDNYHLYVKDNATGAETRIQYQFIGHGVELVKFADGTEWDRARIESEAAYRGSSSAESIFGTTGNEIFYGNGGNDYLEGRAGSDTYVYASGDGADDIFDEVSAGATDVLKLVDLDPADVTLRRDTYHLYVKDNATNQETRVQYQFIGHGIEELRFADGTVWSRSDIDIVVNGGMVLNGGSGNDTLNGGVGNDLARGRGGNDTIDLGQGTDIAEFSGLQADYSLATSGGTVTITDDEPTTDGNDGTDTLIGVETAKFKDGSTLNLAAPIVLDLDGNGVSLIDRNRSKTSFDWDADGQAERTGWVSKKDGLLTYDRNGDGKVSGANELSFVDDKPGAVSDLDGLSAFDTNGDGIFSADDEKFSEFRIWRDANSNGRSDRGELKTLDTAGIASISLDRDVVDKEWGWGENITLATGTFTRKNGSTGAIGDVALNYADSRGAQAASQAASQLVEALAAFRNDNGGDQIDWLHDQLEHRQPILAVAHALR